MSELLDKILSKENMTLAYKQVVASKGASGVDNLDTSELKKYLQENWKQIKEDIQKRQYKPQPVKRVEIPKPNGGVRKLGIPTVVDRTIQQAIAQVLTPIFEPIFSDHSYGFRPKRSCKDAIIKVLENLNNGYEWIIDIDLEKFFDNVPQDKLMNYVGKVIHDGDTESLIRKYLKAGIMENGKYEESEKGTPQGGNLSPLLSNIMLNELDKELERRELNFVRYADDCVILVRSETSAKRVMQSITGWIERKLGLKVNATKTKITRPMKLKYLGYGFYKDKNTKKWECRPHENSVQKFKRELKKLCCRRVSINLTKRITKLNQLIRGWINYYKLGNMKTVLANIDGHLRLMIRVIIWKQWKVASKREWGLRKLGVKGWIAHEQANCSWGYIKSAKGYLQNAVSKERLTKRGLISCLDYYIRQKSLI